MAAPRSRARAFHALTAAVALFALVLQAVLVVQGHSPLVHQVRPDLATRLLRFASYLTIWSNALVAATTLTLALRRAPDTRLWRALRNDAVLVCLGGGIVHFFFLRPILDLHGADALADHLLHQVVPLLALVGWLVLGPRDRISWADLPPYLVVPVVWFAYTVLRGAFVGWYPYPFVDVDRHGYVVVLLDGVGVGVFLTLLFAAAHALDPRLPERLPGRLPGRPPVRRT